MRGRLSFGLKTTQMGLTYDEIRDLWLEADQLPVFEHAWLWDHMLPIRGDPRGATLEAWTLLSALAAQTRRLQLGVIVTSNRFRLPTLLAKMAATVDHVARGRLILGLGAGGHRFADPPTAALVQREFDAYGMPVVTAGEAVRALGEALSIISSMWTLDEPFDFNGRYYRLTGAVCEPKPIQRPGPPILIAASGERTGLRLVAQYANLWNCPTADPLEFRHKSEVLDEYCRAIGRDPSGIARLQQVIVSFDDVEAARRQLREWIEAGCTHLVLAPRPPLRAAYELVREIIEPVLESVQEAVH
jgi:alkanesulfonate monooxygenase SsuD/methylene tetrahydromethanopterin reductase-like flavin-dependent oxidoreductase (luciferase family)